MIEKKTAREIKLEFDGISKGFLNETITDEEYETYVDKVWISQESLIEEFNKFKKQVLETTHGNYTIQLEQFFDKFQKEFESVKEK